MTQLVIENIDSIIIEKLKIRAQQQGRTLSAELKAILEEAAQGIDQAAVKTAAWERIDRERAKYAGKIFSDSVELLREDRQR
ncbi:FitA-like ribbon-helix-helix domain-containing protein [Iningainema tapete]|uniref:Antitoxin FitA-like ribbon-helix-helix domain-containing protein n=1 Tax=Iningainema tapete BLCC-T55 TaxID=2748662 RepID=A0A8J6XZ05_9CYAN|nr:hypothetical protein [Iningainema tapete]MBD2775723.1 hypothetical protein [Iningainema tapete BLCC-T55]